MKKFFLLLTTLFTFSILHSQNVGVGTTTPGAKLTVNGALASTPLAGSAGATITIPANVTVFQITDDGASAANVVSASGPVEGQYLTIYNTDAQAATFSGQTIAAAGGVMTFQYISTGWRLVSDNQATGGNFIKNGTSVQPASNFNISNAGVIGTTLGVGTSTTSPVVQGSTASAGTLTLNATSSATKPAAGILMTDNIPSTSTTTGTSVITGGQGISGNLNVGGNSAITGTSTHTGASSFGSTVAVTPFTTGGVVTNTSAGLLNTLPGTTSTVLHGNAAGTPTFGAVALTSDVSGILPVANGGTGSNTQNYVDLTTNQTAAGNKTWTGTATHSGATSFGSTVAVTPFTAGGVVTNTSAGLLNTLPGTTSTVLHGNAAGTPTFGAVALTSDVSGILPVANGGTGSNTQNYVDLTTNQTAAGNKTWSGAAAFSNTIAVTPFTAGGVVTNTSAGLLNTLPGTTSTVLHGNAAGAPTFGAVSLTSDVSGILPVANGGSGSSTQNWVDLTTNQTAAGNKTWTGTATHSGATSFGNTVTVTPFTAGGVVTNTSAGLLNTLPGTTSTVLHGNAAGVPTFGSVSLTSDVSGILPVANGGTGSNTLNYVDLTTNQTAAGNKTWSGIGTFNNATYSALMTGGNVGIGSTAPSAKLAVITASSDGNVAAWGTGQMTVGQDGASAGALGFSYSTANNTGYISSLAPSAAWKDLGIRAASTYFYYNGGNEIMRLNNAGNVSIGGVAPTAQFHTTGTVRLANYASGLIATDATGTLTTPRTITAAVGTTSGTNQLNITNGNGVAGNPAINMHDTYAALLHANANLTGGGNISFIGGNFNWSTRFIVISNGNGSQYSTSGYFDISQPGSGTVTGVGGAGNVTATASGIPLSAWQALYYIVPVGSNNGSVAANFRVAQYTSALVVPENWLLLAVVNGDDGTVRVGNGIILQPNQNWTIGSGLNSGWSAAASMASSRDDINSTGSSNSVAAGVAMTSLVGSGSDDNQYSVNIPFTVYIGGVAATWLGISTNGFIQFNSANSFNGSLNSNTTLPNGSFTIPTVCYYWDDMVTTGNGLRYATIGVSPNRVFILDFELRTFAAGSFTITGQVHIHEGSNEINVRYDAVSAYACGQSATLGLQLTQSIAMPISCNAKVLDDNNASTQSMSFSPSK